MFTNWTLNCKDNPVEGLKLGVEVGAVHDFYVRSLEVSAVHYLPTERGEW